MKRLLIYFVVSFFVLSFIAIIYCNSKIEVESRDRLYNNVDDIPVNRVGLLLGTSKYLVDGTINLYYLHRIEAAANLFNRGKVKYIVISGDNGRKEYNEPEAMKQDLIRAGVDSTRLFLDFAGFRTFDSVIRIREIFSQDSVTFISQKFHNERAIFIAQQEGIYAIGYNAEDVTQMAGFKTLTREKIARVKVFIDYLISTKPKFLGEKVNIPS